MKQRDIEGHAITTILTSIRYMAPLNYDRNLGTDRLLRSRRGQWFSKKCSVSKLNPFNEAPTSSPALLP